jgi:predicted TIM-barrel fold metal-dependent hydrolase
MGTDYPYDMGEADPVARVDRVGNATKAEKQLIKGDNAARLLGL